MSGWFVGLATLLMVLGLFAGSLYVKWLKAELLRETAVEDVARYSEALREFRSLYTSEVVERAMSEGLTITHDYEGIPGALPLPATLSMLLGTRLTETSGGYVRLYSHYPFPHRSEHETELDSVETDALERLTKNPDEPVHRFEHGPNGWEIRYFTADRMRPSCVDCHNHHPDTPKQDWKVGDVRGVLEVSRPLGERSIEVSDRLDTMVWMLLAAALGALLILATTANRFRRHAAASESWAGALSRANLELEEENRVRQLAEDDRDRIAQEALYNQKLESLGLMAGGIAHDFNNLLLIILGNADLALHGLSEDHPVGVNLKKVLQGGEKAARLTRQLQTYAGHGAQERELVDLNQHIDEMTQLLRTGAERRGEMVLELEENLPLIFADASEMEQVLLNLVTNASESLESAAGTFTIRTGSASAEEVDRFSSGFAGAAEDADVYVVLEVEDDGCGMDEETRRRIFDPFYTTKGAGRGLGLAAVQGILHSHQGGIFFSSSPGVGTLIRLVLPGVSDVQVASPATVGFRSVAERDLRILVVDDDEGARDTTTELLRSHGFDVETAHHGKEGLRRLREERGRFDVAVLDMTMPQMGGLELYWEIEKAWPELKVVFVSGFAASDSVHGLTSSGKAAFLNKPYAAESLVASCLGFFEE